ncbi:MAG: MoxR family ATPase [Chloroflexi bacterium]|nr:MoxR family ATPase [Chloroflexota bacterium]
MPESNSSVEEFRATAARIEREVATVIVGQSEIVRSVLVCIIAGGHALLEGVPGLGKTVLVKTLAAALDLSFSRVQFTPDLMPADIVGTNMVAEDESGRRAFRFQPGPVFTNLLLADEVNRATPKTQSALLEAMQERTVTVANTTHHLPSPFFVLATQNPLEMEGTYPLPEAQLDRFFFKLNVGFPQPSELAEILNRTTAATAPQTGKAATGKTIARMGALAREVPVASHVTKYAVRLLMSTHPDAPEATPLVKRFVRYGSSPRGAQSMIFAAKIAALLDGRLNAAFDDIRAMALPALRHRLILNFEGEAEGMATDAILAEIVNSVPEDEK